MMNYLLAILLVAFTVSVKASDGGINRDTTGTSDMRVSLKADNWSFHKVMHAISHQVGRMYLETVTDSLKPVTTRIDNLEVHHVMRQLTKERGLDYEITERYIRVFRPPGSGESNEPEKGVIQLAGKVIDSASGKPVAGASVGSSCGKNTATDDNGSFLLSGVPPSGTLSISHLGYYPVTHSYAKGTTTIIRMAEKRNNLNAIVTDGYSSSTRRENTGNISSYKVANLALQPVANPLMALQGRVPGMFITQESGLPGGNIRLLIRGKNSLVNGNMPYVIINGAPFSFFSLTQTETASIGFDPLANFNLDDIEQFDILKDADATAIYGSRAANGVIYITTKKPQMGKTKLEFNIYGGAGKITRRLDLMNREQYLQMRRQAFKNDGLQPGKKDHDVNGDWDTTRYTDWQKELIGGIAKITNARVSLSGGDEFLQFRLSGIYRQEGTVYPGNFLNRMRSFRGDVFHRSRNQKLNVNFGAGYTYNTYLFPQRDLTRGIFGAADAPEIYMGKGQLNWRHNTFENLLAGKLRQSTTVIDNFLGNMAISYELTPGITFKNGFGYNFTQLEDVAVTPFASYMPNADNITYAATLRTNHTGINVLRAWTWEPQLQYSLREGPHRITMITGATFQQSKGRKLLHAASGFVSDELLENPGAASFVEPSLDRTKYNYAAAFARAGYTLHSRYLLNLTARRDASSRFGPKKNAGTFWSVGAGWIFRDEDTTRKKRPFLEYGKLRGSIGLTGNDQIMDGSYLSMYDVDLGYWNEPGLAPRQLSNDSIGWETICKTELAVELVTKNGTTVNISLYHHFSNNQLVEQALPRSTGFPSITANLPARVVNTGIEVDITDSLLTGKNLQWVTDFNISIARNRLTYYPDLHLSPYAYVFAIGYSPDTRFLYNYTGVDKTTGLYTFGEVKKDGVLNQYDRVPVSLSPDFYGGWNNRLTYRRWSIDLFFYFVKQKGYLAKGPGTAGAWSATGGNQLADYLEAWQQPGDEADYQLLTTGSPAADLAATRYASSTAMIGDASYIRLKNLSLIYLLPPRWLKRYKISDGRIYLQGQNLLTLTRFKGMDPETWQFGMAPSMPPLRILTLGLHLTI